MALGVFCVHARFREMQKGKRMKMSLFSRRAPVFPGIRGIAVAAACCLFLAFSDNAPANSPAGKSPASAALSVARIPFVENHGQFGRDSIRFVARTFCGAVYVTGSGELLYWLPKYEAAEADPGAAPGGMRIRQLAGSSMLRERFAGALAISPRAGREASGRVGYFKGDSSQWRADLPMIEEVELGQVYPGINLGLRAHGSSVEKVFTVAPGADPGQIIVELEGAEGIEVAADGSLRVLTEMGPVRFSAPVAYQETKAGREDVAVCYAVSGQSFKFDLADYDPALPLVIDPLLASTYLGGSGEDVATAVEYSENGAFDVGVFIAGYTASLDFPVTNLVAFGRTFNGGDYDVFVARMDKDLTTLERAIYMGGNSNDFAYALCIHPTTFNLIVAGCTYSRDFPVLNGAYTLARGGADAFLTVLTRDLTTIKYSTFLGGAADDSAHALSFNKLDNVIYVSGWTLSANFPTTAGAFSRTPSGGKDAFLSKFDVRFTGAGSLYASTYLGGTNDDMAWAVQAETAAVHGVWVAGETWSTNFPAQMKGFQSFLNGDEAIEGACDGFAVKLSEDLSTLQAGTFVGGSSNDAVYSLDFFHTNVVLAGVTASTNFHKNNYYGSESFGTNLVGESDAFVLKMSTNANNYMASTYLGGSGADEARAVKFSRQSGSTGIVVVGFTASADYPTTTNVYDSTYNGGIDGALTRLSDTLTGLQGSTFLGGMHDDRLLAANIPNDGRYVYVAGVTDSENYPVLDNSFEVSYKGSNDVVVSRLSASLTAGIERWVLYFGNTRLMSPAMNMDGSLVVATEHGGLYSVTPDGKTNEIASIPPGGQRTLWETDPVLDADGNIYIANNEGTVFRFSRDGDLLNNWPYGFMYESTPALSSETNVYIGNMLGIGPFFAFQPEGGTNWTTYLGATIKSSAAISSNRTVTVGSGLGVFTMDVDTGSVLWSNAPPPSTNFYGSPAIGSDGSIYIGSVNGIMYGFNSDGTVKWERDGMAGQCHSSPVIATNDVIYFVAGRVLYAIQGSDGTRHGTNVLGGEALGLAPTPVLGQNGTIFAVGGTNLFALRRDNLLDPSKFTTNWHYRLNGAGSAAVLKNGSSPLLGLDGTVYFAYSNKLIAVFGVETMGSTPWPTVHHDFLRTGNQGFSPVPFAPDSIVASKGVPNDGIRVSWSAGANASRYELYRGTNDNPNLATNRLLSMKGTLYLDKAIIPGKRYYYFVRSLNPYGRSALSAPAYGGIPPLPPAALSATKGTPTNSIEAVWETADYAETYEFYRSSSNSPASAELLSSQAETNYTDSNITCGLTYYYWVKSTNEFGVSGFSPGAYGGTPPLAVNPTAGEGVSLDEIVVTWTSSVGATTFVLWKGTVPDPELATNIATLIKTNYFDPVLPPCMPYYYWVQASNDYGISGLGQAGVGWRGLYPPGPVFASDGGVYTTKIHVVWGAVPPYATSYKLYRNDIADFFSATQLVYTYEDKFEDTTVRRGATYYYWVRSVNDYGESDVTGPDAGGTPTLMPTGLNASKGIYSDRINVSWTGVFGAGAYRLRRGLTLDPNFADVIADVGGTSFSDRDIQPGVVYYYWAQSVNSYGVSSLSGSDGGWVTLSPPSAISASDGIHTNRIHVQWLPSAGAATYELWRNTDNDPNTASRLFFTDELQYDDAIVDSGKIYFYWVKAKTVVFTSGFSDSDSGYASSGLADLAALDLVFQPPVIQLYGNPDAVSLRMVNFGPQELIAQNRRVSIDFYLSKNAVFGDADDVWSGRVYEEPSVSIGQYAIVNLSAANRRLLDIPYVDTGTYYVFARVLPAYPSTLQDSNLSNNTTRRSLPITVKSFSPWFYRGINDFDGDGRADLAVYDEGKGLWYITKVDGTVLAWAVNWGGPGFTPLIGDYNQDRKADLALYHESTGTWYVRSLEGNVIAWAIFWGGPGFKPVWGDYDSDGNIDFAVFQPETGNWFIRTLSGGVMAWALNWGGENFQPVWGDYDGDCRQDLAVYDNAEWKWYARSMNGTVLLWADLWGGAEGFIPVPGDYDGDGTDDMAIYDSESGLWFVKTVTGRILVWGLSWGGPGLVPVPGDYDGDGVSDFAIYCPENGAWFITRADGTVLVWGTVWGGKTLAPVGGAQ